MFLLFVCSWNMNTFTWACCASIWRMGNVSIPRIIDRSICLDFSHKLWFECQTLAVVLRSTRISGEFSRLDYSKPKMVLWALWPTLVDVSHVTFWEEIRLCCESIQTLDAITKQIIKCHILIARVVAESKLAQSDKLTFVHRRNVRASRNVCEENRCYWRWSLWGYFCGAVSWTFR